MQRAAWFLAHDPGGYDVVSPVYTCLSEKHASEFHCVGPAAKLGMEYAISESECKKRLQEGLTGGAVGLLVTGSSWGSEFEVECIAMCKAHGVTTVSILDYWTNYALRFTRLELYPDHYIVMDALALQEALAEGVPSDILKVLGHPGLDRYILKGHQQQVVRAADGFGECKALVLSQPLSQLYGEALGYTEDQVLRDCVHVIGKLQGWKLDIKFHPKDDAVLKAEFERFAVDGDLLELIPAYDVIIGMNTMGLLHASLLGVRAISYQPGLRQPDQCITNKLGFTHRIDSRAELQNSITELASTIEAGGVLPSIYESDSLLQSFVWLDGKSTERVAGFLEEVLRQHAHECSCCD